MLINSKILKNLSFFISTIFLIYLFYLIYNSFFIVKNQFIDIGNSTYVNQVRVDDFTKELAQFLTKDCKSSICEVQSMLDFVTNIPYKINENVAKSPKKVVEQNFGDCDDKSNLLISLLKAKAYEAYFVLVPKHIFVVVNLEALNNKKALYINGRRFYILETTATNSKIGFPLKYNLNEIEAIVDPFINKKLLINSIEYK
ncbi:transglutaminase family protein [Aliarcobacter skirrowii]|uniref:transglutaminase-like domain-containing protein n=1 Tax=Aliarcobacter skirrowii TaxID=28200 RepID=UPI00083747ED|nr:transglutaminase family protein [Aliarcobacter skirrowii]MDX4012820.1 transglutaminase family protein [Aliarcobacter skirrowii]